MKKLMGFGVFLFVLVFLSACGSEGGSINDFIKVLEDDGYVLTSRDSESIDYYETNTINQKFALNVEVEELYIAYVNENQRWAEVIVLKNADQAQSFKDALEDEAVEGRIVVLQDNIVLITFSVETKSLFD